MVIEISGISVSESLSNAGHEMDQKSGLKKEGDFFEKFMSVTDYKLMVYNKYTPYLSSH